MSTPAPDLDPVLLARMVARHPRAFHRYTLGLASFSECALELLDALTTDVPTVEEAELVDPHTALLLRLLATLGRDALALPRPPPALRRALAAFVKEHGLPAHWQNAAAIEHALGCLDLLPAEGHADTTAEGRFHAANVQRGTEALRTLRPKRRRRRKSRRTSAP